MKSKFFITVLLVLSGCTSLRPVPVVEPPGENPVNLSDQIKQANTAEQAIENLRIYKNFYFAKSDDLRSKELNSSDANFAGGLLAVLGGAAKSVETVLTGGLISAGGSISSQRFQFKVQALNYEKAGDAMQCMYRASIALKKYADAAENANSAKHITYRIDEVRDQLRKTQNTLDLGKPDYAKIEEAIKQYRDTSEVAETAKMNLKVAKKNEVELMHQQEVLNTEVTNISAAKASNPAVRSVAGKENPVLVQKLEQLSKVRNKIAQNKTDKENANNESETAEVQKVLAEITKCSAGV